MNINWRYKYAKLSIALLFLIITMLQLLSLPGQFRHMRSMGVIKLWHEIFLTALMALIMFSAQIILISLWKSVELMAENNFYTTSSLKWINLIVKALKFALICAVILLTTILFQADDPGGPVALTALTLFISTLFVLTSLLRDQITSKVK